MKTLRKHIKNLFFNEIKKILHMDMQFNPIQFSRIRKSMTSNQQGQKADIFLGTSRGVRRISHKWYRYLKK